MQTPLAAILFDLDGTLIDTAATLAHALNRLRQRYEMPPLPLVEIRHAISNGSVALLKLAFQLTPADSEYRRLQQKFFHYYAENITVDSQLFPNIKALLQAIEQAGLKWGIVTNKPQHLTEPLLEHFQLAKRLDCLITADQVSRVKPSAEGLQLACQQLRCTSKQVVFIGDAESDVLAAKAAGITSILALYGYLPKLQCPFDWQADHYVSDVVDIQHWLAKQLQQQNTDQA